MSDADHCWALVLAAGDGSRLRGLTTTKGGLAVPKQFCSLERGPSLLQEALERARAVAEAERICAIVAARHEQWWAEHLRELPNRNIVVQPKNRGTANGILLPLLHILNQDPDARIVLLPSDHYVRDEEKLACSLRIAAARQDPFWAKIVLLGIEPAGPDPELGYIVPGRRCRLGHREVERFVEKPPAALAYELSQQGALWNAFIIAADGQALLKLFERRSPDIVSAMQEIVSTASVEASGRPALTKLYEELPQLDFSRNILQGQESHLHVLPVPDCGWSDLGTPQRVAQALRALPRNGGLPAPSKVRDGAFLSLAAQHRHFRDTLAPH